MYCVAEALANLFADVFPYSDDIAQCSHFHYLAVVGYPVESGVYQQATFAEYCLDVERHLNVSGIHVFVLQDYCIEFQCGSFFRVHGGKSTKKAAT